MAEVSELLKRQLIPRLPPETLAKFEEVSGLMFLNVTMEEMLAAGKLSAPDPGSVSGEQRSIAPKNEDWSRIFAAINHETYHYFQLIGTGYQFRHVSKVWRTLMPRLIAHRWAQGFRDRANLIRLLVQSRMLPGWYRKAWIASEKYRRIQNLYARLRASAKPDDPSLFTALLPRLYARLDELDAPRRTRNAQGLSVMDLLEGSAVVYQYALTYSNQDWRSLLENDWSDFDDTYRRAFDFARAVCDRRAYDVILPAVALALRYERPADAYPWFVRRLTVVPPGEEVAAARALAENPSTLYEAGRHLGTAWDVRQRERRFPYLLCGNFRFHDNIMKKLRDRTWEISEFDLLVDPGASARLGEYPRNFITRDFPVGSGDSVAHIGIASILLRSASLPLATRELDHMIQPD